VPTVTRSSSTAGSPARWAPRGSVAAWVLCALLMLAGANCLLARSLDTGWHGYVLLATVLPLAACVLAAGGAALLLARRWLPGLLVLAMTAAVAAPYVPVAAAGALGQHAGGPRTLRVVTLNLRLGLADAASVVALLRDQRADVLAVQELTPQALQRLQQAGIDALLPQHYLDPAPHASGVAIFSRLPLAEPRYRMGFSLHVISAVLALPGGGSLTFLSSHLVAPWPQSAGAWQTENARLGTLLGQLGGCAIDAGDFNGTTDHAALRSLMRSGRVHDAATQAGALTLRTFPADSHLPPLAAIDHVLVRGLSARAAHSVHIRGSDHRAVVTLLSVGSCPA
jgi:endonuclease/exonuclease/phosphatase (EEP) superfamily protein YafD